MENNSVKNNSVKNNSLTTDLMTFSKATLASIAAALVACSIATSSDAMAMNVRRHEISSAGVRTQVRMEVEVGQGTATNPAALDLLFVVDSSGSMTAHQQDLKANIGELVRASQAAGVDLHAGVITMDDDEVPWVASPKNKGELVGVSKPLASTLDADFEQVLAANLTQAMVNSGSGFESPFATVRKALSEPLVSTTNKGFLRPDAGLAIFLLTDADDQSLVFPQAADFVSLLKTLKTQAPVSVHAAYIPSSDSTCSRSGEPVPVRIEEVLNAFGTLKASVNLCDAEFGKKLSGIGAGYAKFGVSTVQLKLVPDLASIKIHYGSLVLQSGNLHNGWIYDSAKMELVFGNAIDWRSQPVGTPLVIEYFEKK